MYKVLVQLVTFGIVVAGHSVFSGHFVVVVCTVSVDQIVISIVRGGGWQTVVFVGPTDVVTLWLVLPGHLTQGLVSIVVLVMCSVMILGVGHFVIEEFLLDDVLPAELVFAEEVIFADELARASEFVVVPVRKGTEPEDWTKTDSERETEDVLLATGSELVETASGREDFL